MIFPTFEIENEHPNLIVAGTDEAGRGPLAGPVVAAAVIFPSPSFVIPATAGIGIINSEQSKNLIPPSIIITDSKKLTAAQRDTAYDWITKNTIWASALATAREIDEINILQASLLAMRRAIDALPSAPDITLVDGNKAIPNLNCRPIVKGDSKSLSIAAASIIAKVTRDRIMQELAQEFPKYGWDKNAGYPTKAHRTAIEQYGITPHHRKTFHPIKDMI